MARILMVPQNVHALISQTCECITLHGKGDFADVINAKDPKMGDHPEQSEWPNLIS